MQVVAISDLVQLELLNIIMSVSQMNNYQELYHCVVVA